MSSSLQPRIVGGNKCDLDYRDGTVKYAEGCLKLMTDVFSSTWGDRSLKAHHFQYHITRPQEQRLFQPPWNSHAQ